MMIANICISIGYGRWSSGIFDISLPLPRKSMSRGRLNGLACSNPRSASKFARWSENSMFSYFDASRAALS